MKQDPLMSIIDESSCQLQLISLSNMSHDDDMKKTFCINLYNVMIKHAFAKVGIPTDTSNRGPFFETVGYWLGGDDCKTFFSFSELENGILRGNRIPPGKTKPFFDENDPRKQVICSEVDPRIHFALNCGAKSCPPIKKFTAEAIEEELRIVAMAYCESDDNVKFDSTRGKLYLNQIFNWYGVDFGATPNEVGQTIVQWLRGERKKKLDQFLDKGGKLELEFLPYDWTSDALN